MSAIMAQMHAAQVLLASILMDLTTAHAMKVTLDSSLYALV